MSTSKIARFLRDFHGALNLCNCAIFNYKGSKFIYRTSDGKKGKAFGNFSRTYLSSLGLPPTSYIKDFNDVPVENLVFLTATSWNHYKESLAGVASVLEYFPKNKIMYYDLGLKKEQANEVKKMCGVTYKRFDFSRLPRHVVDLYKYSWKPIVILDVLSHSDWVIWMDASIRFTSNNLTSTRHTMNQTGGFSALTRAGHSIYAATDPSMFRYLTMDVQKAKQSDMLQSGILSFARTREVCKEIMFWWVLCALQKDCMAVGRLHCNFNHDGWNRFGNCNRYDQSALAIIATNKYHSDSMYRPDKPPIKVYRGISEHRPIEMCDV